MGNHQPGVQAIRLLRQSAGCKDAQHGIIYRKATLQHRGKLNILDESLTIVIVIVMQKSDSFTRKFWNFRHSDCCINIIFLPTVKPTDTIFLCSKSFANVEDARAKGQPKVKSDEDVERVRR